MDLLAQTTTYTYTTAETSGSGFGALLIWYLLIWVLMVVAYWKVFVKAGEAGWKSLIPIYSTIVLLKIIGRPAWWILLLLIPFVNLIVLVIISLDVAKAFGKSTMFAIFGLLIFSIVGYIMLGFGDAKYQGPLAAGDAPSNPNVPPATPVAQA